MSFLVKRDDEEADVVFKLGEDETLIGRAGNCRILLDDFAVSHRHARVLKDGLTYRIEDIGSANGTFINGRMVKKAVLRNGDRIEVGRNIFVYYEDLTARTVKNLKKIAYPTNHWNVLVVDDSTSNQMIVGAALENLGCRYTFANNGLEALEKLKSGTDFKIVFMDCSMPVMDGASAVREIRKRAECKDVKIICISSKHCGNVSEDDSCINCQIEGFTDKPVTKEVLKDLINKI